MERAQEFYNTHIIAPENYESYAIAELAKWFQTSKQSLMGEEQPKLMWLRRNGENYTEFAAHIDYILPASEKIVSYAQIDISSDGGRSEIQVWLPAEDGSGVPEVATSEAYTLSALDRAIDFVETQASLRS